MLAPSLFFKLSGVLVIAAIILSFIPIIGQLQSLQNLVLGSITLQFFLSIIKSIDPEMTRYHVDLFPGFFFLLGLVIVGGVMSWIGMIVASLLSGVIEEVQKGLGQIIIIPLTGILGFIPVFMYGAWLGAQLHGKF